MLSDGAKSEQEFIHEIQETKGATNDNLAKALNDGGAGPWTSSARTPVASQLEDVLSNGPAGITVKAFGTEAHMVVAQMADDGNVLIRDPATGQSYELTVQDLTDHQPPLWAGWTGYVVYRP